MMTKIALFPFYWIKFLWRMMIDIFVHKNSAEGAQKNRTMLENIGGFFSFWTFAAIVMVVLHFLGIEI